MNDNSKWLLFKLCFLIFFLLFPFVIESQQDLLNSLQSEVESRAKNKVRGIFLSTDKLAFQGIDFGHLMSFAPGMQLNNLDQHELFNEGVKKYLSNGLNVTIDFASLTINPYVKYGNMIGNVSSSDQNQIDGNNIEGNVFQSGLYLRWPGLNYRGKFFSLSLGCNGGGQYTNSKIDHLIGFGDAGDLENKLSEWSAFAGPALQNKVFFKGFGMYFNFDFNWHFGQMTGREYNLGTGFILPFNK